MATLSVQGDRQLGEEVERELRKRLSESGPAASQVLVSQAKRRIDRSGDSEVTYEDLWATETGLGYRAGGRPLRDTGILYNSLHGRHQVDVQGVDVSLRDGSGYGVKHQTGFVNFGPVAVALTRSAARVIPDESPHDEQALKEQGLVMLVDSVIDPDTETTDEGDADFLMLQGDHFVPARPIFNMPPEDKREFVMSLAFAMGAR